MKKLILSCVFATGLVFCGSKAQASTVSWIDWSTTSSGTLTVGSTTVGVSLTGSPFALVNGDGYYNNGATGGTSLTGTYGGLTPSDLIQVAGAGIFTLTFNSPVLDPYIALVSVGRASRSVTYSFSNPFSVISSGPNFWGYSGYSVSGNDFTGYEYSGVLKFSGAYSSISFGITPPEYWHGFNFGVAGLAPTAAVPEPSTLLLLGTGLVGLAIRKRFKTRG